MTLVTMRDLQSTLVQHTPCLACTQRPPRATTRSMFGWAGLSVSSTQAELAGPPRYAPCDLL